MHPSIRSKGWSRETAAHCLIFVGRVSQDIAQKRNNEKSGEYRPRQVRYDPSHGGQNLVTYSMAAMPTGA